MFWRKKGDWQKIAPASPTAIRISVVAVQGYKKLVVLPSEPFAQEFQSWVDRYAKTLEESDHTRWNFETIAEQIDESINNFAEQQEKALESSIEDVYNSMHRLLKSLDTAVKASEDLETATTTSQGRLATLKQSGNLETLIKGLNSEISALNHAVAKHKTDSKLIRSLCAQHIEDLRSKVKKAESATKTDYLTKLSSRSAFDQHLSEVISKIQEGEDAHLAVLDLNGFKAINDQYGHIAGDAALAEFGVRLLEAFGRQSAHIARLGGDEFGVVFRGKAAVFETKLDRLAEILQKRPFMFQGKAIKLTTSYGTSALRPGQDPKQAFEEADMAMYRHKRRAA
jgi:diguanylate cyclase (GGDEF)-like protein